MFLCFGCTKELLAGIKMRPWNTNVKLNYYKEVIIVKKIPFEDFDSKLIGSKIHLVGTVWKNYESEQVYIAPLWPDLGISNNTLNIIEADEFENIKIINDAWLLEAKRNEGFHGRATKVALVRSQKQVEPRIIWRVFRRDKFACVYCGDDENAMTYDHFVPRSLGGPTNVENGRTACKNCNLLKGDMKPDDWLSSNRLNDRKKFIQKVIAKRKNGITNSNG